jgi:hypothetical protein
MAGSAGKVKWSITIWKTSWSTMKMDADQIEELWKLPTQAIEGSWLLKQTLGDEQRFWVNELQTSKQARRQTCVNNVWVTTAYFIDGMWRDASEIKTLGDE